MPLGRLTVRWFSKLKLTDSIMPIYWTDMPKVVFLARLENF